MPLLDYSLTDSSTANEQAPTRPLRLLNCSPFCSSLVLFKTLEQRGCFSFGIRWHKNLWLSKHQRDKELVLSVDFASILWQEVSGCFLFLRNMNALCIWCLAWHLTSFSFLLSSAFCYPCCCRWSSASKSKYLFLKTCHQEIENLTIHHVQTQFRGLIW